MEVSEVLIYLRHKLEQIDRAIAEVNEFQKRFGPVEPPAPKRRGRRWMPEQERAAVSKRMLKYWSNRRKKQPK